MRIKKSILILLMCLALPLVGQAQSAHWAIQPTYQSITRFAPRLFKVKTYISTGILDVDDKWVVSPSLDSITYLTNGYALALKKNKDKFRIIHIIRQNGTHQPIKDELYVGDFAYFSEDRCPVMNKKGKYGFMDPAGKLVVPCNYTSVQPFQNGRALVSKEKGGFAGFFKKVTKKGKTNIFEIDLNGNARAVDNVNIEALNDNLKDRIGEPYVATPDPSYQRISENNMYGYKKGSTTLLPTQFEEAERVSDDCAIVMVDHLYGVLKFNSATLECKVSESGGKLTAEAEIPSVWDNKVAMIIRTVNGASRKEFEMEGTGTQRSLSMDVAKESGDKVYELACEKLILLRIKHTPPPPPPPPPGITVKAPAQVESNIKGICSVTIRVVNNTGSSNTINISLSTGQKSSIKLAAGKSGSVTVNVPVKKRTKCTITARGGGKSSSCSTTLIPRILL